MSPGADVALKSYAMGCKWVMARLGVFFYTLCATHLYVCSSSMRYLSPTKHAVFYFRPRACQSLYC